MCLPIGQVKTHGKNKHPDTSWFGDECKVYKAAIRDNKAIY